MPKSGAARNVGARKGGRSKNSHLFSAPAANVVLSSLSGGLFVELCGSTQSARLGRSSGRAEAVGSTERGGEVHKKTTKENTDILFVSSPDKSVLVSVETFRSRSPFP